MCEQQYQPEILKRYDKKVSEIISIQENEFNPWITIHLKGGDKIMFVSELSFHETSIKPKIKIRYYKKPTLKSIVDLKP